jgi:hypothetical protein
MFDLQRHENLPCADIVTAPCDKRIAWLTQLPFNFVSDGTSFARRPDVRLERRPFKWRLLDNVRYASGSDRGRVAAQYVAKGQ